MSCQVCLRLEFTTVFDGIFRTINVTIPSIAPTVIPSKSTAVLLSSPCRAGICLGALSQRPQRPGVAIVQSWPRGNLPTFVVRCCV